MFSILLFILKAINFTTIFYRQETHKFKRQSNGDELNTLSEEMQRDVIGTKSKSTIWQNPIVKVTINIKDSVEITGEPDMVKTRWKDYFSNLLNVETQGNDEIGESRIEDTMDIEKITEDEVKRAVDRSRNGKAPGCDIIPNEIFKTGNPAMICGVTKRFYTAYST